MRYLITGGAGFVGSWLAESLLDRGHSVAVLDDLSTGSMENIEPLIERDGFRYTIGSATDASLVLEEVDRADFAFHLAAAVGVRLVVERPVATIETNLRATEVLLDAASRKSKPVLITSTSEVYGKSQRAPFDERDDLGFGPTFRSRWAYACSKAMDEWLAFAYWRERGVPIRIARLFNTVGPRQTGRYGMVLPSFARQALRGEPITVYGDGSQTRCFAHVRDVCESLIRLARCGEAIGEVVNIGSTEETTILALAELVREVAGSSSELELVPYDEAYTEGFEDMPRRVPAVARLKRLVDFSPETSLRSIVEEVVEDQRARLEMEKQG